MKERNDMNDKYDAIHCTTIDFIFGLSIKVDRVQWGGQTLVDAPSG